jgi:hypothetical protein
MAGIAAMLLVLVLSFLLLGGLVAFCAGIISQKSDRPAKPTSSSSDLAGPNDA